MSTKMKLLNKLFFVSIATAFIFLASCSNTPGESRKKNTSPANNIQLNAEEQKTYQEALGAIKTGQADKAIQPLTNIASNHPEHLGAWINLANAYVTGMKIKEAENAVTHAKSINPNLADIYNLQGLIAMNKGEYTNAEKNYLQAIALKNNYSAAHYNLGLLYDMYYQDLDQAVVHYERYLQLSDGADKNTTSWVAELKQKIKRRNK